MRQHRRRFADNRQLFAISTNDSLITSNPRASSTRRNQRGYRRIDIATPTGTKWGQWRTHQHVSGAWARRLTGEQNGGVETVHRGRTRYDSPGRGGEGRGGIAGWCRKCSSTLGANNRRPRQNGRERGAKDELYGRTRARSDHVRILDSISASFSLSLLVRFSLQDGDGDDAQEETKSRGSDIEKIVHREDDARVAIRSCKWTTATEYSRQGKWIRSRMAGRAIANVIVQA
ncbi:hypothetical protein CERSUDRAFT_124437 [Gelatoporia subvermispora B]|uniref:Uncharacterized protein n=1 Tax=Ceriporiopsis subvermispora (strain B) TaxID=914234 RepID=M2RAH8_CERS8|nr:hypothetical protein CERSUDRAFT_124437 [Gelatoporia subvermispora B]